MNDFRSTRYNAKPQVTPDDHTGAFGQSSSSASSAGRIHWKDLPSVRLSQRRGRSYECFWCKNVFICFHACMLAVWKSILRWTYAIKSAKHAHDS